MKLGIVGSRTVTDYAKLVSIMALISPQGDLDLIVSGGAAGADTLAELYANDHHIPIKVIKPDWNKYGKQAGFMRNGDIVVASDIILALWDGSSRGTKDTLDKAHRMKRTTIIIYM